VPSQKGGHGRLGGHRGRRRGGGGLSEHAGWQEAPKALGEGTGPQDEAEGRGERQLEAGMEEQVGRQQHEDDEREGRDAQGVGRPASSRDGERHAGRHYGPEHRRLQAGEEGEEHEGQDGRCGSKPASARDERPGHEHNDDEHDGNVRSRNGHEVCQSGRPEVLHRGFVDQGDVAVGHAEEQAGLRARQRPPSSL
jgi:hypothetical protein